MIESPIRRKYTNYPKDFLPSQPSQHHNPSRLKRFTFNDDYQIEVDSIKKYQRSLQQPSPQPQQASRCIQHICQCSQHTCQCTQHTSQCLQQNSSVIQNNSQCIHQTATSTHQIINPQKSLLSCTDLIQESRLDHRSASKKPDMDSQLLKKPRFTLLEKDEISQNYEQMLQDSSSPGCIRKQLQNRQTPLPKEDPCRIELVRINSNKMSKVSNSYIKYKSSAQFENQKFKSSEKDIIDSYRQSRTKFNSFSELPKVSKVAGNQVGPTPSAVSAAKEQYDSFRRRQQSLGGNFGKVNSLLAAVHRKEGVISSQLPRFQNNAIQKLKQEINILTKAKKGKKQKQQSSQQSSSSDDQTSIQNEERQNRKHRKNHEQGYTKNEEQFRKHKKHQDHQHLQVKKPQLLISYRSSLPYLKDLYSKSVHLTSYHLIVKIPKLFTQKLIFKQQQREQLYQTAKTIFQQLKIPYQNLVIKRYTNCTMIISRNICLIWHFDGKRYLGGWQSQYLDEGFKHGLGLEWQPKKYVYYGQFMKNKKHGLGIYKDRNDISYIGYWKKGSKADPKDVYQQEYQQQQLQNQRFDDQSDEQAQQHQLRCAYSYV